MGELGGNDQTGNRGRGQGREDARDQSRQGKSGDIATTRWRQLAEDTNLDTQGANVAESAQGVGSNKLRAGRQSGVVGVGGHGVEGIVLVLQAIMVIIISHKSRMHNMYVGKKRTRMWEADTHGSSRMDGKLKEGE